MAISSTTVWEVRTTGSSTNGGGYVSGGTDYSQQDGPQLALTDIAIADGTTTTITSATGGFTAAMIGNMIYLTGGSGGTLTTQRRQITAVADTNTITVDQAPAPSAGMTGVTGNVGGALSGPWDVHSSTVGSNDFVLGNTIFIKSGTYNRTETWISKNQGSATLSLPVNIVGYDTNRSVYNIDTNRPIITTSTNSVNLFAQSQMGGPTFIKNIIFSHTASIRGVGIYGYSLGGGSSSCYWVNCRFTGFTTAILGGTSSPTQVNPTCINCEFDNCTGAAINSRTSASFIFIFYNCYIHDNDIGFLYSLNGVQIFFIKCVIVNNNTYGLYSDTQNRTGCFFVKDCVIANNGVSQIRDVILSSTNTFFLILINNIIYGGQYCLDFPNAPSYVSKALSFRYRFPNAFGGASISNLLNISSVDSDIILTEDPFVDSVNRDYRLNNKAGGGKLCKNTGYVRQFPGLSDYRNCPDLGYYQSQLKTVSN